MRLSQAIEKAGTFWLVENPEDELPGTLTISNGGVVRLEIIGNFGGEKTFFSDATTIDRIIGKIEQYGLVTLDGCHYSERNFAFGAIAKSKIRANCAFLGVAYDKNELPTFDVLEFSIDCAEEWLGITGIVVEHDVENRTGNIRYQPVGKISYQISETIDLHICYKYTLPSSRNMKEAKITQECYFKICSKDLVELDLLTEVAYKVLNFTSFAVDRTLSVKNMVATTSEIVIELDGGRTRFQEIPIFYQSSPFIEIEPAWQSSKILFTFTQVGAIFQNGLRNWFSAYESFSPALSLYFSVKNGGQKHLEGKFLALAQALETYHRRTSREVIMDAQVFSVLVEKIIESAPLENAEWLKGRLQHGNEINLRKRLNSIIEPFKSLMRSNSKMVNKMVDTRNYLTHYSPELYSAAAKDRELWVLCMKMEAVFQLTLLKIIGFTDSEIAEISNESGAIKYKIMEI